MALQHDWRTLAAWWGSVIIVPGLALVLRMGSMLVPIQIFGQPGPVILAVALKNLFGSRLADVLASQKGRCSRQGEIKVQRESRTFCYLHGGYGYWSSMELRP